MCVTAESKLRKSRALEVLVAPDRAGLLSHGALGDALSSQGAVCSLFLVLKPPLLWGKLNLTPM